ncbi:MAG: hypothetical protein QOK29_2058 [Rhodospirillaceae bacterium]|nr:hypothetical protein [Rhodospirillaceae bacterium]
MVTLLENVAVVRGAHEWRVTVTTNMPSKTGVRAKAAKELKELIVLTLYLYVAFAALIFYKSAVLRGVGIGWMPWGLAAIKAVLVAKFVLIGSALRIGERYQTKPLIWPTLYKSVVFLAVVLILTVIEEAFVGLLHGRTMRDSISAIGGGTPEQLVATLVIVFFIFFPYFAIRSLGEVMGEKALFRLFFVERQEFRTAKRSGQED